MDSPTPYTINPVKNPCSGPQTRAAPNKSIQLPPPTHKGLTPRSSQGLAGSFFQHAVTPGWDTATPSPFPSGLSLHTIHKENNPCLSGISAACSYYNICVPVLLWGRSLLTALCWCPTRSTRPINCWLNERVACHDRRPSRRSKFSRAWCMEWFLSNAS